MKLYPDDTIDMKPYNYNFSFAYMPNKGEDCYTYATGIFNLLPAVSTVRELNESFIPEVEQPIVSDDTGNSSESGDNNGN